MHHLPAVSDAAANLGQPQIDWVVEEAFAAIAAMHPAVRRVIPVKLRRVQGDRERFLPLLLEADESEEMVRAYLNEGELRSELSRIFRIRPEDEQPAAEAPGEESEEKVAG